MLLEVRLRGGAIVAYLLQLFLHMQVLVEDFMDIGLLHQIPHQIIQHLIAIGLVHLPHDSPLPNLDHLLQQHHLQHLSEDDCLAHLPLAAFPAAGLIEQAGIADLDIGGDVEEIGVDVEVLAEDGGVEEEELGSEFQDEQQLLDGVVMAGLLALDDGRSH